MTKLNGSLRDVQPVKRTNRLRTRIGKYRVIFEKTELGISVTKIDKRGRVYKR